MRKLTDIQILKLGKTLHHINTNNFFYGQQFPAGRVISYEELAKLPMMDYKSLAKSYPFALSCADTTALISARIQKHDKDPVMNLFTINDLSHIAEMTARAFSIAGITQEDTIILISGEETCWHILNTCEKLQHFLIPAAGMTGDRLMQLVRDTEATCLTGTTDDLIKFVEFCRETSFELTETSLEKGLFCGRPLTEGTRKHIEKESGMNVYVTGGFGNFLTGACTECRLHDGMHVWDDHYIAEIIDTEGNQAEDGTDGELVVTTLSLSALPLVRFRTGKTSKIISREKCECGLTTPKISYPA